MSAPENPPAAERRGARRRLPVLLGVTGYMASGKSAFSRFLCAAQGWPLLEADRFGHEVLRPGSPVAARVVERFGSGILDSAGAIDRAALGRIVFSDPSALLDLNRLTHPAILSRIQSKAAALRASSGADIILLDAALLPAWLPVLRRRWTVWVVIVAAPLRLRLARLAEKGWTREAALTRMRAQVASAPPEPRTSLTVENRGALAELAGSAERVAVQVKAGLRYWRNGTKEEA